jgi:hypothetical protein
MALKGDLRDFSTTQLLNLINLARKTGTLTVDTPDGQSRISFLEGNLIYASADGQDDHLVSVLRSAGKISMEEARTIERQAGDKTDRELGVLLINAGRLSRGEIEDGVRRHVLGTVYRLFTWPEGSFRFDPNYLPVKNRITISIGLENVIVEGSRRIKEWERLQDELPDLNRALKFADRPGTNVRNISLSVEEWRVISFINPRNTIQQIAQYNNLGEFQIRKIVYGLLQAGLVEILPVPGMEQQKPIPTEGEAASAPVKVKRPAVKRNVIMRLIDRIREL